MHKRFDYILIGSGATLLVLAFIFVLLPLQARAGRPSTDPPKEESPLQTDDHAQPAPMSLQEEEQRQQANAAVMAERRALFAQWLHALTQQPGWLHVRVFYERDVETGGILPDGVVIPGDYIDESWYGFDAVGTITHMVGIMWDMQGNRVQFATYQDGLWWNSALQQLRADAAPGFPDANRVQDMTTDFLTVTDAVENGRPVKIFTYQNHYPAAALDDMEGVLVNGSGTRETIDAQTGQPLRVETFFILTSGAEYKSSQYEYLLIEYLPELPDVAKQLLAQKVEHQEIVEP